MCNTFIVAFGFLFSVQGIYLPGKPIDKLKSKLPSIMTIQDSPQMQASEYLQPPEMPLIGGPESLPDFLKFPRAPKPAEVILFPFNLKLCLIYHFRPNFWTVICLF